MPWTSPDFSQSFPLPPILPHCLPPINHYNQGTGAQVSQVPGQGSLLPPWVAAGPGPGCGASGLARQPGLPGSFHTAVLLAPADLSSLPQGRHLSKSRQLSASTSTCWPEAAPGHQGRVRREGKRGELRLLPSTSDSRRGVQVPGVHFQPRAWGAGR